MAVRTPLRGPPSCVARSRLFGDSSDRAGLDCLAPIDGAGSCPFDSRDDRAELLYWLQSIQCLDHAPQI
jgi:hypothetical protein